MRYITILIGFIAFNLSAQVPAGYYDSAEGLSGQPLRSALQEIIDGHAEQTYASIWTHFLSTDQDEEGYVWDMYSDIPGGNPAYVYIFIDDQCGNYGAEGDCYNREHSFPKSWFNDAAPMVTDLFQIYPTDGYVNGKRSNYPYGEVGSASWVSTNGSRLGSCSYPGYSSTVFEPIDEYKGDFARTYFYMLTRYMDQVSLWESDMLSGNDFSIWAKNLLLEWSSEDPVSSKEIDRNNAVYQIQENRNPFIDHPEYALAIWGDPNGIEIPGQDEIPWTLRNNEICFKDGFTRFFSIYLVDISGRTVYTSNYTSSTYTLPDNLTSGLYVLIIHGEYSQEAYKLFLPR